MMRIFQVVMCVLQGCKVVFTQLRQHGFAQLLQHCLTDRRVGLRCAKIGLTRPPYSRNAATSALSSGEFIRRLG